MPANVDIKFLLKYLADGLCKRDLGPLKRARADAAKVCEHPTPEWNTYLANQWQTLGYNITEKKDPLPDAEEWANKEKTEQDILTWEADA